jgi:hypothetical protein
VEDKTRQDCLTLKMETLQSYTSHWSTSRHGVTAKNMWTFDTEFINILVYKHFWRN